MVETAEKKLVVVLYVDIRPRYRLPLHRSPELYAEPQQKLFERLSRIVLNLGGTVNAVTTSQFYALFGIPQALEDTRERALRAAHLIRQAILRHNAEMHQDLVANIGMHEGFVSSLKVNLGNGVQQIFTGEPLDAARELAHQALNHIAVSDSLARELNELYEFSPPHKVEALPQEPLNLFQLLSGKKKSLQVRPAENFVGRQNILTALYGHILRLQEGVGGALLLTGDPGIGKTEVLYQIIRKLQQRNMHYLFARCLPRHKMTSFFAFRDLLERYCGVESDDPEEGLNALWNSLSDFLPPQDLMILEKLFITQDLPPEDLSEMKKEGSSLLVAFSHFLDALRQNKPLVVIFDDVQYMDADSKKLLSIFREGPYHHQVLLILAMMEQEDLFFLRGFSIQKYPLGPMTDEELLQIGAPWLSRLEPASAQAFLSRLLPAAKGNPLFFLDNLYYFAEHKREKICIPNRIFTDVSARIDRLSKELQEILKKLSVLGPRFYTNFLHLFLKMEKTSVRSILTSLEQTYFIFSQMKGSWKEECLFYTPLIPEVIQASLPEEVRMEYHREAVNAMLEAYKGQEAPFSDRIAAQFIALRDWGNALYHSTIAFGYARTHINRETAEEILNSAQRFLLEKDVETVTRIKFYVEVGRFALFDGAHSTAEENFLQALKEAEFIADKEYTILSLLNLGILCYQTGRWREAQDYLQRVVDQTESDSEAHIQAASYIGYIEYQRGRVESAMESLRKQWAASRANSRSEGIATAFLGLAFSHSKDPKALSFLRHSREIFQEQQNRWNVAAMENNIGFYYFRVANDLPAAEEHYNEAYDTFRSLRDNARFTTLHLNFGLLKMAEGNYDNAREHFGLVEHATRVFQLPYWEVMNLHRQGVVDYYLGAYTRAYERFLESVGLAEKSGIDRWRVWGLLGAGEVLMQTGRLKDAQSLWQTALKKSEEEKDETLIHYSLSRLGVADSLDGKPVEGRKALLSAMEFAARIREMELLAYSSLNYHSIFREERIEKTLSALHHLHNLLKEKKKDELQYYHCLTMLEIFKISGEREWADRALHKAENMKFIDAEWRVLTALGNYYATGGNREESQRLYFRAQRIIRGIAGQLQKDKEWYTAFLSDPEKAPALSATPADSPG